MKNARNNGQIRVKNCLKWTASGLLLALMFVLVFAGTLSGAFGIESDLQQNGIIQSNVASAASQSSFGTYNFVYDDFTLTKPSSSGASKNSPNDGGVILMKGNRGNRGAFYAEVELNGNLLNHVKNGAKVTVSFSTYQNNKIADDADRYGVAITSAKPYYDSSDDNWGGSNNFLANSNMNDDTGSDTRKTAQWEITSSTTKFYVAIFVRADGGLRAEFFDIKIEFTYSYDYPVEFSATTGGTVSKATDNITGSNGNAEKKATSIASVATPGYHFVNWTKGNTSTEYSQNTTIEIGSSDFFEYDSYKANFALNRLNVVYWQNHTETDNTIWTDTFTYTQPKAFRNLPKNGDKTFVGWSTSRNGAVVHGYNTATDSGMQSIGNTSFLPAENDNAVVNLYAVWVDSDFGVLTGHTADETWGTINNPFVIKNAQHLINLSDIVNDRRDPVNSVDGKYFGANINTAASDIKFENCYFVVAADLGTADAQIALVPIGKDRTHYFAGTIFGGNDSDANNRTMRTINLNIQQSDVSNVGLFGYVKGATATISHLTTAGTIVGGAAVGGLVGYADGVTISNCRNNATVKALGSAVTFGDTQGAYLGGFVGYATASVTIKNCYNGGEITTETKWPHSNIVGGIVGHLGTGGKIEYCYNKGKVVGSDNIGGIAGINNGAISFCYQDGELNDLSVGTEPSNFITSNGGTITNCWILPGASRTGYNQDTTPNGKKLELIDINNNKNVKMYAPAVVDGTTYTVPTGKWESIVEKDINGFEVFAVDANGNKLSLQKGEYLRSAKATPTIINSNGTANVIGQTRQDSVPIDVVYVYSATVDSDVFVSHSRIGKTVNNTTYNGKEQTIGDIQNLPQNTVASVFYFENGNAASTATSAKKDWREGGYVVVVDIKIGDKVVGRDVFDWTINKKTLTVEYQWTPGLYNNVSVVYNGEQQGLLSFEIKGFVANESVASGNATVALTYTNTDYTLAGNKYTLKKDKSTNVGQYGVSFTLEANNYALDTNATHAFSWTISLKSITIGQSSFYYGTNIEQKLTDGTVFKNLVSRHSVRVDTQKHNFYKQNIGNNQYTILQSDITVNDNSGQSVTGNYNITGVIITVLAGDFWSDGTTDIANNPWGSPRNPYVIGKKEQLTRLSSIVGGTSALNSTKSDTYVYVQAQSGDYSGAYFKLADNIPSVGNITPIGSNTHPFKGNFDGNNKAISGLNISVAGNNVGLFGYISGATIKYLTVNGSVKGLSNVGGVVGYALNSTIENVTNNASISSTYKDAPYEIKQFDAHPHDTTNQAVSKVNDGDLESKYYSAKKGAMSFIVQNTTLAYIFGFAITNANDTNNTAEIQKRTPQSAIIWGSNNDFQRDNYTSGGGNTNIPYEWGWEEVYNSTLAMPSTNSYRKEFFSGFKLRNYKYYYIYVKAADNYSTLQFAEFDLLTTNSQNVGGVVGYAQGTSINKATNTASVEGDTMVGGIVGYADSTSRMYGLVVNSGNITANSMVGGVSGENHGFWCDTNSNYGTFKNSGSINGRNGATVGGVTAFADKEMRNAENTGNVIGGNAVGGVAGRVQAPIKNSYNSGEIVGTNPTAQGEISVTPTPNGVFVGGITGYTTGNGTILNCYNKGHIAAHSASGGYIDNGDYVGGIVGFAQAKVEYCANIGGLIEGNNFIGGIIGSALDNTNVDYCYDVQGQRKFRWDGCNHGSITGSGGNVTNSWAINEKQVQTTANNPNPVVSTKGYRLTTAFAVTPQVDLQNTTNQKWEDILSSKINGFKVVGSVAKNEFFCSDNGTDTKYVKPSKTEGFVGDNGDVTAWYSATIASNIRVRVQNITLPTIGSKEYDGLAHGFGHTTYPNTANGAAANNPIVYTTEFLYVGTTYKENLNESPTNVDVYNTTVTIKIDGQIVGVKKGDTVTITERLLKVSNVWTSASEHAAGDTSNVYIFHYNTQHQGIIENGISVASVHGGFAIPQNVYTIGGYVETKQAHNDTTHMRTFTLNDIRNYKIENKYSQYDDFSPNTVLTEDTLDRGISEATVGDTMVVTYKWKIVPYSLATNIISGNVWFGGTMKLIVGNQGIANVKVGNTNEDYYPLQADKKGTGVQQVLVYAQHNYAAGNFVLYVKYNNGNVATLTQGTEYTVGTLDTITNTFGTFNVSVVSQDDPVEDTNVTARGTGNFSGIVTKYYTALFSDFGWKDGKTPEDNDWGGSADNPYVISKPEHLLRLSQIVNGGMAWNSIITANNALCISPQGTAVATDRAYSGAYFLVTADIDMTGNISTDGVYNFLPIGHRNEQSLTDMPFSGTFDGNGKAITFVYNTENFGNGARVDYVGLFGYLNGATVTDLIAKSIQVNGIKGRNYVGGIVGYAENSHLVNVQKSYGDGVVGENYVGGVVGYAENTLISCNNDTIAECNVTGAEYVGGIVGKWIVTEQTQIGGSDDGQARITPGGRNHIIGTKYVGGLFGWLDMSGCEQSMIFKPQFFNEGLPLSVTGTEYVGALFGVVVGNGYHQSATQGKYTAIVISDQKVNNITLQTNTSAKVVGGFVGYAESVGILFETDWNTSSTTFTLDDSTSFFGGVVGVLGKNSTIEAIIVTKEGDGSYLTGSEHTILNNTALGTSGKPIGSFVGGIVGYVSSQAGTYWEANTTIFGNGISLVNSGQIHATGYAGGIFGALGDLSTSVAQTFENDTNSILYKVLTTGVRSGNANTTLGIAPTVDSAYFIGAKGKLVNNASLSVTDGYVGGIAGYSGAKVRFVLRNKPQTGAFATANLNVYSGGNDIYINGSYAGGIAGYLVDNLEHELQYIVVQAKFESVNAKRVGGLVGYMGSGKVENCVVTNGGNSNVNELTDTFKGSEYVGGLVGETQNAIITNSVSTGFNLAQTTNTKGGLLGGGTNPTIESSWTFYIAQSKVAEEPGVAENKKKYKTTYPTYSTVSKNTYGEYVLVDNRLYKDVTFADLCKFAGITQSATAGILEFSVDVPSANKTGSLKNKQLAFYDASGSDAVTSNIDSFKGFDNSNNVLTVKLDMESGTSMQVCVVDIEFVNIPQHDTDNDETAHAVVESTYKKPSNSTRYHVDVTQANFDIANTKQVTYIKANVYFECNGTLTVISDGVYLDLRKVGDYDSGILTPGSQENPYTISNQKEWNDFAYSVYTGTDYTNKYVKLLTNDIVINTGNNGSGMHEGTKGSHNFGSVQAIPSAGQNAPLTDANGNAVDRNNIGYNFAGDISHDGNVNNFHGTFDGNGHYITVNYGSGGFYRVSVFPNAAGATFRNLTIKGYIQAAKQKTGANGIANSAAYDVAGFVGKPFGTLKFYNCTNEADIIGLRNVAGLVGYNAGGQSITLEACVNTGDITSLEGSYTLGGINKKTYSYDDGWNNQGYGYGTGGIIGSYTGTLKIESCRNAGTIKGGHNVGGIIGLHNGTSNAVVTIEINNCANTGNITSNSGYWNEDEGGIEGSTSTGVRQNIFGYAGGIVGKTGQYSILKMYASYNTGTILTLSNMSGGLAGGVGSFYFKSAGPMNAIQTGGRSEIVYCYNTGDVYAGGTFPKITSAITDFIFGSERENIGGTISGGFVGCAGNIQISQGYNAGNIWNFGHVSYDKSWQIRAAGIVGQSEPVTESNQTGYVLLDNLYNVGTLSIRPIDYRVASGHTVKNNMRYGAAISGYIDKPDRNTRVKAVDCYSINNCISSRCAVLNGKDYEYYKNGLNSWNPEYRDQWYQNSGVGGIGSTKVYLIETGRVYSTYDALTAAMDENSRLRMTGTNFAFGQSTTALSINYGDVNNYTYLLEQIIADDGSIYESSVSNLSSIQWKNFPDSWLYVYGCLPQLSVFALDTQNGLSMRSVGYGKNDYGEYNENGLPAGSEQYPYIIKDGVDLMGMQALVDAGYSFESKYIEVADGTNTLDKLASKQIKLATYNSTDTAAVNDASNTMYKAVDQKGAYRVGKSYHLLLQGAIFNKAYNKGENPTFVGTDYASWAWNTYYYNGGYRDNEWTDSGINPNKFYNYGGMRQLGIFALQNFIPMGRGSSVFKGHFSGEQANGENTTIDDVRITTGKYGTTTEYGSEYGGLFAKVQDAYIGYISIGGSSKIWSFTKENDISACGGMVGLALGDTVIDNCGIKDTAEIGSYGVSKTNEYVILDNGKIVGNITNGNFAKDTYAGGIVGMADPKQGNTYNAGITTTIRNCFISSSGRIESAKSNIGGVLGYVGGDAGASGKGNTVRIEGCSVDKAVIQAASSATESSHIGGVLGYGSEYVAAFITGCSVGNGAETVTIKGEHSLGGIAGGMSNAKGGYIDSCIVGEKATIERINQGGGNISENPKHGTAIGGLVGFTEDSTDTTSPLTTTFSGTSAFSGKINVTVGTTNPGEYGDKKPVGNVGGIVGDMGSGANFASGSDVTVGGTINITLAAANVGGVAGRTSNATFIGKFDVSPNMTTPLTENVGGFIGKNVGTVYILADTTERIVNDTLNGTNITIGGTIRGTSEVGGFIGVNNSGSSLNIGSNVANARPYTSGTLSIIIAEGATISGSGNHVGGIVGKNEGANNGQNDYATIDIVKGKIEQNGTISGKNYVGGIIGLNQGLLTTGGGKADEIIGGIALSDDQIGDIKNLSITNKGSVKGGTTENNQDVGGDCVGGVIGKLDAPQTLRPEHMGKGDIAGAFENSGSVEGNRFVGGSLGYVGKYVNIATKGGVNTLFVNTGNVTAHSTFVGGSIGAIVGQITGAKVGTTVNFENQGTVNGLGYVGGSIGVLAGQIQFAQFVNSSKKDFTIDACNSVGGSVGYIGMPDALKTILNTYFKDNTYSNGDITVKNVHFEASGNLTANPSDATLAAAKDDGKGGVVDDNDWGGVGGAIGVIGKNVRWGTEQNKNTYYANGNVTANGINNVGGIVGIILAENVNISNMLAYNTTVKGGENVGGIVGATDGIGTVITSAYAIEGTFTGSKNVGGIIGLAKTDTDASTSYWVKGYANSDIATYDVKDLSKLGFTTGKATTGWFFLYANDATGANGLVAINTSHSTNSDLQYWKRIANAYTAQERADGDDKKTIAPPSGIVSGGQPQYATLYATATAASVNGGYYLYTATSNNDVTPTIVSDAQKYFISVTTNAENADEAQQKAGNVAVFYRQITKGDNLKYNGYNRNAVVGMDGVNLHLEEPKEGDVFEQADRNKYFYTTSTNAEGEGAVGSLTADPGTYKSTIKIYLVDNDGKANIVGGIKNLEWKIDSRELTVKYEGETSRPYGSVDLEDNNKSDKTITITNIAPNFGKGVPIKIVINVGNDTVEEYTWTWNNDNAKGVFTATHKSPDVKLIATEFSESGDTLSTEDQAFSINMGDTNLYKLKCALKFVNAKNYTIKVVGDNKSNPRYTVKTEGDSSLNVTPVKLTLKIMDGLAQSQAFDGKAKGTVWVVDGFKYNDGIQQFALFDPSFNVKYKDNVVRSEKMTSGNMQTGVTIESGPMVQATHPIQGEMEITLSNAIKRGDYYLTFAKTSAGNYTLDNKGSSFSIAETTITIECDKNGKSKTYDKTSTELIFTFTASVPNGIQGFDGIENYAQFISEFFKLNGKKIETSSMTVVNKKTIEVKLSTGTDAKTYSFAFSKGDKYDEHIRNCAHTPTTLPTYKYTINRRPLTLTTTMTGTSPYIYNTSHQGLDKVSLNQGTSTDNVGLLQDDSVKINISGSVSKTLTFKNKDTQSAGISTIDAGTYSVSFALSGNNNYTLSVSPTSKTEWTINQYVVKVGNLNVGTDKVYDALAVVPTISIEGMSGDGKTFTYHNDTVTISYSITKVGGTSYSGNKLVNAGQYTISIGGTNSGSIKANRTGTSTDTSKNYTFGNTTQNATYTIAPRPIEIVWNIKSYVYNESKQMLQISGIKIEGNDILVAVFSADKVKGLGNDTLTFSRSGGGINVGTNHTTNAVIASVSGKNDEVDSIVENYTIKTGGTSGEFAITPSKLKIVYSSGIANKVYDATTNIKGNTFAFTVSSTNGGANGKVDMFTITKAYDNKNVSNGYTKTVNFKYSFTSADKNYEFDTTAQTEQSISNIGQITPAHIKVALDKLRSGKATRTFTNDERYGGNGASGNNRSQIYRAGEGFSVSDVLGNDSIVVTASYREALDSRNGTGNSFDLSKYVNDVEKNENTFTKVASGTYYKTLVFNLTGDDAANYTFNVYRGENKFGENDSTASASQNITVYDSRDKASGHQNASGAEQIKIEITVKSVRVEYSNTAQSYANDDNTYNKNWLRVMGTNKDMQGAGAEIVVTNGWMYQDGKDRPADSTDEKREYHGYTTIRGSQNSERLGAAVSKVNGMDLNYRLSNQPVLTIAYFVADGGEYKIDSLARLLIASFYYTAHQSPGDLEIVKIVSSGYQWVTVVSNDKYEKNEEIPAGFETWDAYFAKLKDDGYEVFLNVEEIKDGEVIIPANTWGYYQSTSNTDAALPTSYKLTKDISGKFTQSDIAILNTFFTVTTVGDDGHITQTEYTWSGANSDYLKNVLSAAVDKVATINGSLFVSQKAEGAAAITGFDSTFDGNGYVIEYLNIMGYDKENVGLFDIIGANGSVKNLHLRNITINANQGNVGGIAGSIGATESDAAKNVTNVSFHGKITATGGTVGGLFGTSARAIDGAIVLGEISATNANVGGVVGTATAGLNNVVSMMQITASGGTVGAFTSDNAHVGENCTHMTNTVWKKGTSGTGFVNVKDKNVSYNALMSGSNSLYANGTSDLGTYDVISETFADSGQNVNPRQSKRLRDMVSVYLLMYSLSANGDKYTISSSSWLVGTADGTDNNKIVIANKQNVSLLRELRFAAFVLKVNVSIDVARTFTGAFYGSVTSAVNESGVSYGYKITCNKPMFEAYATEPPAWLVTPTQP